LVVIRTVSGQTVSIKLNLNQALVAPKERILIQPNDYVFLQYTEIELIMNLLTNNLQFNYLLNNQNSRQAGS